MTDSERADIIAAMDDFDRRKTGAARMNATEIAKHDAFVVLTDLEPDDMVAIVIFLEHLKAVPHAADIPMLFVTGEGGISKRSIMQGLLLKGDYLAFFKHVSIMDGHPSTKDYPASMYPPWGAAREKIGSPMATENAIRGVIDRAKNPLILCLKPPRELLSLANNTTHATMAIYGSFNLRSLKADPKQLATWLHGSFASVLLYETFLATGERNSINGVNGHIFWDNLLAGCKVAEPIMASVAAWNFHILGDCLESARDYAGNGELFYQHTAAEREGKPDTPIPWGKLKKINGDIMRNMKIVDNIVTSNGKQMVMADFGLVAALFGYIPESHQIPCRLSFNDRGYTVATPEEGSTVRVVKDAGFETAVVACTRALPY